MMASGWVKNNMLSTLLIAAFIRCWSWNIWFVIQWTACKSSIHTLVHIIPLIPFSHLSRIANLKLKPTKHNGFRRREGHRRQRNRAHWMQYDHWIIAEENMLFFWAQGVNGFVGISKVRRLWGTCSGGRQHQLWGSKMQEAPLQEMSLFTEGGAEVVCGSGQDWGMGGNEFRGKTWGCSGKQG